MKDGRFDLRNQVTGTRPTSCHSLLPYFFDSFWRFRLAFLPGGEKRKYDHVAKGIMLVKQFVGPFQPEELWRYHTYMYA